MTDLTLDKIKNILGAHNDGVYRLQAHENLGEIVGFLMKENDRLRDICVKAEADYRGVSCTFKTYGFHASAKEAWETADYIKEVLEGSRHERG